MAKISFRYGAMGNSNTANDFRKTLSSIISALYKYPTFRDIANDLKNYL